MKLIGKLSVATGATAFALVPGVARRPRRRPGHAA